MATQPACNYAILFFSPTLLRAVSPMPPVSLSPTASSFTPNALRNPVKSRRAGLRFDFKFRQHARGVRVDLRLAACVFNAHYHSKR